MQLKFINFYSYRNYGFILSIILTIATIFGYLNIGLNFGIDFKGGLILEVKSSISTQLKEYLNNTQDNLVIQKSNENLVIRLQDGKDNDVSMKTADSLKSKILYFDKNVEFLKVDFVGPKVSNNLMKKAIWAFIYSLLIVMVYIFFRFNWKFSIGVFLSLVHDLTATFGFYVFTKYEFNLTSVAAILTVIGYSVNDSVVIYDRIRENSRNKNCNYIDPNLINKSVNETLSRTIMTFLTTFAACFALWLFGGESLKSFSAVLTFGVAFGTYSSIFVSANILHFFTKK